MHPNWFSTACPQPSEAHAAEAHARQTVLTKPAGALGRLESLAIELASLQRTARPTAEAAPIIVFAGDHGVTVQGVSAYPSDVTVQMLNNFTAGGAAISVLSRALGVPLTVIDAGTHAVDPVRDVITDKPRCGTRDFTNVPALESSDVDHALACGCRAVERARTSTVDVLILGEMGIGNTTAAAAVACALTGHDPADIAGNGTGLDADGLSRKTEVIRRALAAHNLAARPTDALSALTAVGGLEITALVGAIIAAAQNAIPVLVDGYIVSVAALAAVKLNATCRPWLLFAHQSAERGHRLVLQELSARPILDLELRLGEATGAALALPILRLACALHNDMATFEGAAVSRRIEP